MINKFLYHGDRNSNTELNEPYFWTISVKDWIPILGKESYSMLIIESLQWLCSRSLVRIYGFVIMPNHIHLLWEQLKMNGKELPKASFTKFTAHQLQRKLQAEDLMLLERFRTNASDRQYNIWQRDALAIRLLNSEMAFQKLVYLHNNPLQEHWNLCSSPETYRFSSAGFYENEIDEFGILTHYTEVF